MERDLSTTPASLGTNVRFRWYCHAETAEAAHDFRNILGIVCMLSELAQRELSDTSPLNALVQQIREACADGNDLCERMMEDFFSRSKNVERVDLSTLVMSISPVLETFLPKDSKLDFALIESAPVYAVPGEIRRIIYNLVKNAAEALGSGTRTIMIGTGIIERIALELNEPEIESTMMTGQYSYLSVSDTGCGMDEATRASRFDEPATTKGDGHGLGISSVQRIVFRHGGLLQVQSRVGCGTTFIVLLPCAI